MAKDYRQNSHHRQPQLSRSALQDHKNVRYMGLYQLLLEIFARDRDTLLVPRLPAPAVAADPLDYGSKDDTYILIDLSNIYIGFCKAIFARYPSASPTGSARAPGSSALKMDLEALDLVLQRGRSCLRKILCGSYPSRNERMAKLYHAMFEQGRALGYEVSTMDRIPDTANTASDEEKYVNSTDITAGPLKEHGVDEMLSFQILEVVLSRSHKRPGTIVLTTGDGQSSVLVGTIGFYRAVEKALANGWSVELYSFGTSLSQNWVRLRDSMAQLSTAAKTAKFRIIYLDEFIDHLYDESFTLR